MIQVLFVCLGNICRSPAAEGVMTKLIEKNGLSDLIQCDSAGTSGFHRGEPADSRMRKAASERDYHLTSRSRQFNFKDFEEFDYIVAMDDDNYSDIYFHDSENKFQNKIYRFRDFCLDHEIPGVPDPYYGGEEGFQHVLDILEDGCQGLLNHIKKEHSL